MAQRLGLELAAKGFTVVSGLARGIDSDAHQGALDGGGKTIAVLGCGVDVVYPPENRQLAENMVEAGGALISELPIGTPPIAENFPTRNRLISGICLGVVIVEAAEKSGSLITARMALEQDRQVFAVPGSPLTGKTRGSNRLLKEGARLVECVEDVLEEILPQLGETAKLSDGSTAPDARAKTFDSQLAQESAEVQSILLHLKSSDKLHVDALIEGCGLNAQTVLKLMLDLELRGLVMQHPGKLFSLA
jgi:DNA processing protein